MDYFKKDISNPGPGQYFLQIEKQNIKKRIYPPFYTSGKRSSFIKKEEIPGPGSYDLIDKSFTNKDTSFTINHNNNNQKEEEKIKTNMKNSNKEKSFNNISTINIHNRSNIEYNTFNNSSSFIAEGSTLPLNNNSYLNTKIQNSKNITNSNSILLYNNSDNINITNNNSTKSKLGFLSQAIRFNDKDSIIKANDPGPGTYEAIDYTNNLVLKNQERKNKSGHKLMKASFKIEAGSLNRIVSIPSKIMNGYTYEKDKNLNKEQDKNKKNKIDKSFTIIDKKREKENFSNMGNINKEYSLIIDKNTEFGKNMPTCEYVGPGSYDIYIKQKGTGVVEWSKGFNIKDINKKKELLKTQKVFDEMKKYGDSINNFNNKKINILSLCKTNSSHFLIGKYKKGLNDINKRMLGNINKANLNTIYYCRDSFIQDKSEIPGPGYYSKELINKEKDTLYYKEREKEKIEEKKMNNKKLSMASYRKMQFGEEIKLEGKFGSNCDRFLVKNKSMGDLGPTTYFIEKNKFEPNPKPEILKHLKSGKLVNSFEKRDSLYNYAEKDASSNIDNKELENKKKEKIKNLSKTNTTFFNQSMHDNPGPGEYELSHSFIIPSYSQVQMMNSQVERFPDIGENTPGPGAYLSRQKLENEKIEEKLKKIISHTHYDPQNLEKLKRIEEIKESNRKRNDFPGAGAYNPGFLDTINYKVRAKINPRQSYQSPFLLSSERFKFHKDDKVSPANYNPYKYDKEQKNLQYMAFGKSKRFGDHDYDNMKGIWHLAGPGSYDVNKDSWNKKTYNALFSNNL